MPENLHGAYTDFKKLKETLVQRWTRIKNRPEQFPDDLPPYWPSTGKIVKKMLKSLFPRKNDHILTYTLPAHWALPKCKHGQSAPGKVSLQELSQAAMDRKNWRVW